MNKLEIKANHSNHVNVQMPFDDDHYRSIIESDSFYVLKTNLKGRFTYINPLVCDNFGLKSLEWLGRPLIDLVIPEDQPVCLDALRQCFANLHKSHCVVLREPCYNRIVFTQWEFRVVQDQVGCPKEILCIGHDITSQITRQQELQALVDETAEQNKKLVNFTYVISHNICSHVANIIGIIELNETGSEAEKEMSWNIIKKSITSLDATIHNLSDIIQIQTKTDLPCKRIYLRTEIARIITGITMLLESAAATITYHFNDTHYLETNPAYLESIILNLLTNAVKYRSPHRLLAIDLYLEHQEGYLVFMCKDNGVGINMEVNGDKVFGMYKTFHGNADAKGLGLFLIKTQIEALGGKIEVSSVLHETTTFRVYFKQ